MSRLVRSAATLLLASLVVAGVTLTAPEANAGIADCEEITRVDTGRACTAFGFLPGTEWETTVYVYLMESKRGECTGPLLRKQTFVTCEL